MASVAEIKKKLKEKGIVGAVGQADDEYRTDSSKDKEKNSGYTGSSRYQEIKSKVKSGGLSFDNYGVDQDYINSFFNDADSFFKSVQTDSANVGWSNASSTYDSKQKTYSDLYQRSGYIRTWLNANKGNIDTETYDNLTKSLDQINKGGSSIIDYYRTSKDYYARFESEDAYNRYKQEMEAAKAKHDSVKNEYESAKKEYDIMMGEKNTIKSIKAQMSEIQKENQALTSSMSNLTNATSRDPNTQRAENEKKLFELNNQLQEIYARHGGEGATNRYFKTTEIRFDSAHKKTIDYANVPNSEYYDPEFQKYAQMGADIENPTYSEAFNKLNNIDNSGKDIGNMVTFSRENYDKIKNEIGWGYKNPGNVLLYYMTNAEVDMYNYRLVKYGKKVAAEYLGSLLDILQYKMARGIKNEVSGNHFQEMLFAIEVGIDQFGSGLNNIDNYIKGTDPDPVTVTQMAGSLLRKEMDGGWGVAYDAVQTTANMLPSIGASLLANTVVPGSGVFVGNALMGASSAGGAYAEMRNLGYDANQARGYATLVAASEIALQNALGGISPLGSAKGGVFSKATTKALGSVDNALARFAIQVGGNMLDEGFEEAAQSVLEPIFKFIVTGEKVDVDWGEVAYSGLLGALSAGMLEGPMTLASEIGTYDTGKAIKEDSSLVDRLTKLGSTMSADSVAYKLAGKVDANTGAYTVGRLLNELGASLSESNMSDIVKSLERKGITTKDANTIAKWLNKAVEGEYFNKRQIKALEENDLISKTFKDVIVNQNSTVWQRINGYTELQNTIKDKASDTKASVQEAKEISSTKDATKKGSATETKSKASESGKTMLGDKEVNIKEIASIKDGEIMLRLDDDSTVNAKDVDYESSDVGLIYEAVADMNLNAATANAFVKGYNPSEGLSVGNYIFGFKEAYKYGEYGFPINEMSKDGFSSSLSQSQKELAYGLGKTDAKYKTEAKQKEIAEKSSETAPKKEQSRKGKVHYEGGVLVKSMTPRQKASIKGLETVAEALGVDIYVFESEVDEDGKRKGANGWFDPKDGSIHIDIYAGQKGEGTMLFTAAHELTHFIREWSPAKFKVFADFLLEQYGQKGISVDELVSKQIEKAKRNGRDIDFDTAYEEVIADSCESFLADGDAIAKIAELKAKDKTLWQKIKDFLTDLVAKIKAVYERLTPDSVEGQYVSEMLDSIEKLKALWTEALVDASDSYNASNLVEIDTNTESVAPTMLSERTWTESEYVTEREETAKKISKALGVDINTAYKYIDNINSVARLIADDRARLDYEPNLDDKATVLKPNSEYKFSVDMSTLCAKRLLFTGTFDAIQRALPNMVFDSEDIVSLREMMQKRGYEVACGICYVESTRREIGKITQDFIDSYKKAQQSGKPITRINSEGKEVDLKKTKDQKETTADKSTDRFYAEKGYTPTLADLNTTDIDLVKRDHPLVYEAYLNFMNARGQVKPKLLETRAEYKGEILKHFKYKSAVEARNNAGGLRLQSFSDFEVPHLIDMMQIVMDMSRVGLKSQAYTKVPAFAEVFGDSGVKINLSLIAKGDGLDANGNLIFDDVEGINHKEAFKLRDKYSKNVGTILVGKTDAHIIAAMADPRIDYIIPFHKSSWKESLYDALGLTGYADYTDFQNEKPIDKDRKIKNFDPSEYWDFTKSGDENAQIYLEKCREDGRIPKFPQFQGYPGYWKLLIDFKMYDNDGVGSPQEVVRPVFNTEASERILGEYKGGHKNFPVAKDVVEDFVKEHKDKVKYSDRDSLGNELSTEQQEFFKDSKVRDKKGNLLVVYHGTTANFNTFKRGDVGFHFGTKGAARGRVGFGKNVTLKEVYLNITNPIVFDIDLGSWDADYRLTQELFERGILTRAEAEQVLLSDDKSYRRPTEKANKKLAELLLQKGYDGIAYSNTFETKKATTSYIIFNSNQAKEITNRTPTSNSDIRYSERNPIDEKVFNPEGKTLDEQLENILHTAESFDGRYLYIGRFTPNFIDMVKQYVDINDLPIAMNYRDAYLSMESKEHGKYKGDGINYHNLGKEGLKSAIESFDRPEQVLLSKNDGKVELILEGVDKKGNKLLSIVALNTNARNAKKYIEAHIVTSIYGKRSIDRYVSKAEQEGRLIYNKNEELTQVNSQVQYEGIVNANSSVDSIPQNTDIVNRKFSDRDPDSVSNRTLLANALESIAQNDAERSKLKQYKEKIALIESEQVKLSEIKAKIKDLSFAKGARDTKAIKDLQFEANQSANRINTYDKQLLNLEATAALKGVLEREKEMARKREQQKGKEALARQREKAAETQRELMTRYQESRKKNVESRHKTAMRHKIKDVVNELNQYLTKGTKDKHVPIELQKAVAEALDAVNMDTVGAEERIAKKRDEMMRVKTPEAIEKLAKEIRNIEEMGGNMAKKLSRLKTAYDSIINSDDPLIANSHDDVIASTIDKVIEVVGETPLRDMSLYQLEAVYDMYKMVLTSVRNANKAFKAKKGEAISVIANRVMEEIDKIGKKRPYRTKAAQFASTLDWNNLKPVYAFERIGSDTFTEVFNNVRAGEDTWAVDITEAKEFSAEQRKKHKYDSWDFKKRYGFKSSSGMDFELSLDQIMSLYAYSKREQAKDHLKKGGIVFDETTEVTVKNKLGLPVKFNPTQATAYNLSDETLADIISELTPEQKAFVDAMQEYLSSTMGEKGNEVSLALYGVKLYKEKNYFPLKSATQFMAKAKEQQQGEVKIKNSGFSKETAPKASNPIVLTPFMDVWANHVNDMSMYHAFVLPLEDFYRVFNYKTPTSDTMATESVEMYLQNAYGKVATKYIDQLLKDLNGGARVDSTVGVINKLTGLFKKSAVFASLSVVIQQPSSIARATALVDAKYFVAVPHGKHKATWAEVKKYAPVAIIKEMGYFDTGMGQSTVDWIKDKNTLKDKVDNAASKAPAIADELAWCTIWKAVKRETLHTHKDLKPNSEEFLKVVGERFTEVITKTQVYDSVLSRSANMRSKDTGMKMATAFMGEPTTSLNMLENALTQGKRGNKRYTRKAIGAVINSMILNAILVSLVYAGRDDDEEKTYTEKYISTLTKEIIDGFNPLSMMPFAKDIVSIAQGYDVERSDMAVITDIIKAWNNLDNDNRSAYRKVEDFAGAIASIFGLPVKNIMRDARGIYNTVDSFVNGEKTTGAGIKEAVTEAITGKEKSNGQQLYEAIVSGDTEHAERVKGRFEDQKAIDTAIRKALRENDPRIMEAAVARNNGDIGGYMRIAKEIIAEGNFKQDDVVAAINTTINALNKGEDTTSSSNKVKGMFEVEDYYIALADRDEATAYAVKEDVIKTAVANGKDRDEAEESFLSSFVTHLSKEYKEGNLSDNEAVRMLVRYADKTEEEASSKVQYWEFKKKYPDYELSESAVKTYYEDIEPYGISVDVYYDYTKGKAKCIGTDSDGDGRADSGTKKAEIMYVIHSLPLTSKQKDALYFANGWSKSTLNEAPWH